MSEQPFINSLKEHAGASPLSERATKGLSTFEELGWPNRKLEHWRYTSLRRVSRVDWSLLAGEAEAAETETNITLKGALELRFNEGRLKGDLPEAPGLKSERWAKAEAPEHDSGVTALREAALTDSVTLNFDLDWDKDRPVLLIFDTTKANSLNAPEVRINVVPGGEVKFLQLHIGAQDEPTLSLPRTKFVLGEDAKVTHVRLVDTTGEATIVSKIQADVPKGANYASTCVSLSGKLFREELEVALLGETAHSSIHAFSLITDSDQSDHSTQLDHLVPEATSDQIYKYVCADKGHGVFHGRIKVHKDAQLTDANQMNQTILMSDDARIDTRPQLEVFADDVVCTHGATIGQISSDELFYLMSRGFDKDRAQAILLRGFALSVISEIGDDEFRAAMITRLDEHLNRI